MSSVNIEEKNLIFDYCVGITSEEESEKARKLIDGNKEASLLYSKIMAALVPLSRMEVETCPDSLVESTLLKVKSIPTPNKELTELIEAEKNKKSPIKIGFLRNFSEVAAIAAALIIMTGVLVPAFGYARERYRRQQCSVGMNDIYKGLRNYMSDNNNQSPSVARTAGAPWWKTGKKEESVSADWFLLVSEGYVGPKKFICPSAKNKSKMRKHDFQTYSKSCNKLNDFPDRKYVDYSFTICCPQKSSGKLSCRKVLLGDRNPIFEELPSDYSVTLTIELEHKLLDTNSFNHNRSGQNILFGDGRVEFMKDRQVANDDFYTIRETDFYHGNETPSCSTDNFLAP